MDNLNLAAEEVLETEEALVSTTSGISMYPMLRDRKDTIIVKKPTGRLKKYDVALYRRGEHYVLHRIIKVLPDSYIIRGDNCEAKEYGIKDSQIIGVLDSFYRGERHKALNKFSYKFYVRLQHKVVLPIKAFYRRTKRALYRFLKRK